MASKVRYTIERIRSLGVEEETTLKENDSIKLVKQKLTEDYQIPVGYNGISAGLEVKAGVNVVIPEGSKLVVL